MEIRLLCQKLCALLIPLLSIPGSLYPQINDPYEKFVFGSTSLINTISVQQPPARGFEFFIQHRFGLVDLKTDETLHDFFGMDLTSNIRFGFIFNVTEDISLGFARTKIDKQYEFNAKVNLLKQKKDNTMPISLAFYGNMAIMSDDFPLPPPYPYYADSVTRFEYKFSHRLSYFAQLIVARKFTNWLSLQVSPMLVYKNLVNLDDNYTVNNDNYTLALSIGGWIKTSMRSGILVEWSPVFNKPEFEKSGQEHYNNISIAYEIRPVGHSFQIVLTNSQQLLPQAIYTERSYNVFEGQFYLGFNLHRYLYYRKRK